MSPQTKNASAHRVSLAQSSIGVVIYAVLLGAIVAVIAGYFERCFRFLAYLWHEGNFLLSGVPQWLIYGSGTFLACPILYLILVNIPEKRQHNPADIISGIHIYNGIINAKASLLSALAAVFSIGFGFSVGYYAPTVQLGAGCGFLLHKLRWIRPAYYYISIGAGTAAAIAAIFHSPIGAVVFVHEVLFRFFSIRAFAPITIAAVTSYIVSNQWFDKVILFSVPEHYAPTPAIYLIAAVGGVLAAVFGISMIRGIIGLQRFNQQRKVGMLRQLFIGAALTALVISAFPQVAGSSFHAIEKVLDGQTFPFLLLIGIFIAKLLATMIAFGFGVPGGIFGPTIFIGAALGAVIVNGLSYFYTGIVGVEQIIIITTMAATVSAVIGSPIAMILITVELTGDFQIISVVMLAVVMANITAYRLMGTSSFFDIQLKSRGFDFEQSKQQLYTKNLSISSLISDDFLSLPVTTPLEEAQKILLKNSKGIALVVDEDDKLVGQTKLVDIEYYLREMFDDDNMHTLEKVTYQNIAMVYRGTSVWDAMQEITHSTHYCLPVVDGEHNRQLLGVVYHNVLIACYLEHIRRLNTRKNARASGD